MPFGFGFFIRAEGGEADNGRVNLYDGSKTIGGLARCLNLVAHAFANNEKVRTKGDNPRDVKTFLHASTKGCFEERVDLEFSDAFAEKMGLTVVQKNFWDYLKWSWSAAIGQQYEPTTPYVRALEQQKTPYADEIAEGLQAAMVDFHRLISEDERITIRLAKLKGPDELEFNFETYQYVAASIRSNEKIYVYGNVTKYNILSGSGRYYDSEKRMIVSFLLLDHKSKSNDESLAVRSMDQRILGDEGKIRFSGYSVTTARGVLKRFLVDSIELEKL
jgi:hypothetical protein